MLNRYNYYTGIVFSGYTYGTGAAIVTGGRYNNLLSKFGKDAPSVGFAIHVDELMSAISRNKVEVVTDSSNILILYDIEQQHAAIKLAAALRLKDKKKDFVFVEFGICWSLKKILLNPAMLGFIVSIILYILKWIQWKKVIVIKRQE